MDCPPSLSMLTVNAMTAADTVLVPIQCEYYAGTVTGGGRHGWNRVKIEGKWYWIDVTWMDCGKSIDKNYYLKHKLWKNHKITELGQKNALIANVHYVELR